MNTTVPKAEADFHLHSVGLDVRVDIRVASFSVGEKPKDATKLLTLLKNFLDTLEPKDLE